MDNNVENVENPLDVQLAKDTQDVKESLKTIIEFTEIQYVPGLENRVGYFPNLEKLPGNPVNARFSYGKDSPNMSAVFFDSANGESEVTGERNTRLFLESQKFDSTSFIQVLGKFEGNEAQIEEVSMETLKDKQKAVGNVIFTRDHNLSLIIKPADCPTGVLYCKDKDGNDVVAIIHGGADAINAGLTRQGLTALQTELGVNLSEAKLAIFPGVSEDNFFISRQWRDKKGDIKVRPTGIFSLNWGDFISPSKTDDPEEKKFEKRYVDILNAFEMQALQAGMSAENIEAYRRNTYEDAAKGIAYSRRYSGEHNDAHNGGNLVAIKLNPKAV